LTLLCVNLLVRNINNKKERNGSSFGIYKRTGLVETNGNVMYVEVKVKLALCMFQTDMGSAKVG
jgi:hypothetical protein